LFASQYTTTNADSAHEGATDVTTLRVHIERTAFDRADLSNRFPELEPYSHGMAELALTLIHEGLHLAREPDHAESAGGPWTSGVWQHVNTIVHESNQTGVLRSPCVNWN
jgi:hypothetical protein